MKNLIHSATFASFVLLASVQTVWSQDIPEITEQQKSVILFDIRATELLSELDFVTDEIASISDQGPMNGFNLKQIKRVFGSFSLPANMETIMNMARDKKVPYEYFVRIELSDESATDQILAFFAEGEERKQENKWHRRCSVPIWIWSTMPKH